MVGVGKILPDELGHLVLNEEGAVLESSGELQYDERIAGIMITILKSSTKADVWPEDSGEPFKKMSINYSDHSYVICRSNAKIHIVKRKTMNPEPVKV